MPQVIGITGRNCAGKDTLGDLLVERGFERHSLSDVLRVELDRRGVPVTRPALIALGRELRAAEGPAVLARRVRSFIRTDRVALVSVRSPAEVEALREMPGFVLVSVDAPVEVRFERERRRDREGGVTTLEAFRELEAREDTTNPHAQQLDAAMRMADIHLENGDTLEAFARQVSDMLGRLGCASPRAGQARSTP